MSRKMVRTIFAIFCLMQAANFGFSAIMSGEKRAEKMASARALLDTQVVVINQVLLSKAPSPFSSDLGNRMEIVEEDNRPKLTGDELLLAVSEYIKPTGIFMFGGEYYLVFKENKIKTGSNVGIMYNDTEYSVTIVNITRNAYQVQLGESQLQLKLK